ncbi:MAG TPA: energy transducer TonB [Candidatus Acidoferrales bacterium]|jgi:hypothetical protein|nr:energy transducer TonB [Candidatus Acidoferrales bacterium]
MRRGTRFLAFPLLIALTIVSAAAACRILEAQDKREKFVSPSLATASDIVYPINSGAAGVVVIAVNLDSSGGIKNTVTLRDVPSLTAPVLLAIQKWTFKPATLDGRGVDSTIVVSVAFNPSDYRLSRPAAPTLGKELEILAPDSNGFLPPRITAASWAEYPINSEAQGAVILDARVNRRGQVKEMTAAWGPSLVKTSAEAAKRWTFEPAKLNGTPVSANTVIGCVYRPPNIAVPTRPYRPTPP